LDNLISPIINAEIDFNTFDVKNADRIRLTSDSGVPVTAGDPSIFLDGSSNMVANIATAKTFLLKINNVTQYSFDSTALDLDGRGLVLDPDGDSRIIATTDDLIAFDTGGFQRFSIRNAFLKMEGAVDIQLNANKLILDADLDTHIEASTDDRIEFHTSGFERVRMDATELQMQGGVKLDVNGNRLDLDVDGDTYIIADTDDRIEFFTLALERMRLDTAELQMQGGVNIDLNGNRMDLDVDGDTSIRGQGDDLIQFEVGGTDVLKIEAAGKLTWNTAGIGHTISPGATTFTLNTGAASDTFRIQTGGNNILSTSTQSSENRVIIEGTNTIEPVLRIFQSDNAAGGTPFGQFSFYAVNDNSGITEYFRARGLVEDDADTDEHGGILWSVMSSGAVTDMMTIRGGILTTAGLRFGIFGAVSNPQPLQTSTDTNPTAGATYGTTEQRMIQNMWDALVAYGWLDETP